MKKPHITVEVRGTEKTVLDHESKKLAHEYASAARREGRTVYSHAADFAVQYGLDPRAAR